MTPGVVTAHLDDVPAIVFESDAEPDWKPLRHHLGIGAFGVNAWVAPEAGGQAVERHDEAPEDGAANGHEELYVVVRGHARFTSATRRSTLPRGRSSSSPTRRSCARRSRSEEGTTVLVIGAARGVAFEPSDWEQSWLRKVGRL